MDKENISITSMNSTDKWLFAGQLLSALGALCISIGTTLKLAQEGRLPSNSTTSGQMDNQPRVSVDNYFN